MSEKILYVDDQAECREWFARVTERELDVVTACDGAEALERVERDGPFAIVVSDYRMPGAYGAEVLARVHERSPETVTMLLTGFADYDVAVESLEAARVSRVLEKPCPRELLLAALREGMSEHRVRGEARARERQRDFACEVLNDFNRELETRLEITRAVAERAEKRSREAEQRAFAAARGGIEGLVRLAGRRNAPARAHAERVARYTRILAADLHAAGRADAALDGHWVDAMEIAARVHDIGKVCVPDALLSKHGSLTGPERAAMERHTEIGADVLRSMLDPEVAFARLAFDIAEFHHERWDGHGYPQRLAGNRIPLAARVVAVADCYDALTAVRPYKTAWPHARAAAEIVRASGAQFDPELAACFERCAGELERALRALDERDAATGT